MDIALIESMGKGEIYIMLISDVNYQYSNIVNEMDMYITKILSPHIQLLDFVYSNSHSSVGGGYFLAKYHYCKGPYIISIENDRFYVVIEITDPQISDDDKVYYNHNSLGTIYSQIKNKQIDSSFSIEAIKTQVDYLHDIIVKKDPQFFPAKRHHRAKSEAGKRYWEKYWEEHQ
jgi:sensor histidine kinase YesM